MFRPNGYKIYKIHIPYHIKWMQVNNTSSIDQFKQKAQKDVCGFRTSEYVTSYIENDCLQVFFQYHGIEHQTVLLSHCDASKVFKLNVNKKTQIQDEYLKHSFAFFIVK